MYPFPAPPTTLRSVKRNNQVSTLPQVHSKRRFVKKHSNPTNPPKGNPAYIPYINDGPDNSLTGLNESTGLEIQKFDLKAVVPKTGPSDSDNRQGPLETLSENTLKTPQKTKKAKVVEKSPSPSIPRVTPPKTPGNSNDVLEKHVGPIGFTGFQERPKENAKFSKVEKKIEKQNSTCDEDESDEVDEESEDEEEEEDDDEVAKLDVDGENPSTKLTCYNLKDKSIERSR
jgi:hypothetical protein